MLGLLNLAAGNLLGSFIADPVANFVKGKAEQSGSVLPYVLAGGVAMYIILKVAK